MGPKFSFAYIYIVGATMIIATLSIFIKAGELSIYTPSGRKKIGLTVGGYLFYFLLHGLFIFIMPYI